MSKHCYKPFGLLIPILLASCTITGLTDGYKRLSPEERSLVAYASKGEDLSTASIRMLNGQELREQLPEDAYNLVYYYVPGCRGADCKPYELLHKQAQGKLNVFVVTRNLETENLVQRAKQLPIYGIDRYYYKTKYTFKLKPRFFADLTGLSLAEMKREYNSTFLFDGKKYLHSINHLQLDSLLDTLKQK